MVDRVGRDVRDHASRGSTRCRWRPSRHRPEGIIVIYAATTAHRRRAYTGGVAEAVRPGRLPAVHRRPERSAAVPAIAGPDWRERWCERVESLEPWLLRWLEEQADGPYWRQGSLRPGYERIACPTMLVAGWADGYRNGTFRVLERLEAPARLLFGPWSHMATDNSLPGPRIDLVPEMARWWDRWLRDERNGVDERPPVTVFIRHSTRPAPDLDEQPGVWRDEPAWPPDPGHQPHPVSGTGRAPGPRPSPPRPGRGRRRGRPGRLGGRPAGGAARRRQRGLDQLRRASAVRAAGRPAGRRCLLAGLRLGAGGGAGDPRPSAAGGPGGVVGAGGVPVGQAVRRAPGRDLDPGGARVPQPDPAAVADRPGAAAARGGRDGRARARRDLVGARPGGVRLSLARSTGPTWCRRRGRRP